VAQGLHRLRAALPGILATRTDALSPRLLPIIADLVADWRRLDERIDTVSLEIETQAKQDAGCERLTTVPGIGPIISSATVAAIGTGDVLCPAPSLPRSTPSLPIGLISPTGVASFARRWPKQSRRERQEARPGLASRSEAERRRATSGPASATSDARSGRAVGLELWGSE
jgi:hypothetical protein